MAPSGIDETVIAQFRRAMELHVQGSLAEAEALYDDVLKRAPSHFDAVHNLGVLKLQQGDHEAALRLLERALSINPQAAKAHLNIGNVLRALNRPADAIARYDLAIALAPQYAQAHNNRGVASRDLGRPKDAVESYLRALQLQPDYAEALCNCATAFLDLKRFQDALACARQAIALRPTYMEAHLNCAHALNDLNRTTEAIASYREALRLGADAESIRYYLAALGEEQAPSRSPRTYVETLFDQYADTFDSSLTSLKYDVPRQMRDAVVAAWGAAPRDIADIGCGTGMCGPLFRPMARTLVGADLSSMMLRKAGARGAYDRLVKNDLVAFLRDNPAAFDLVIAADVFIYVGDLDAVFAAARVALRPEGRFAFSAEGHDGEGFVIRASRRFAHSLAYVDSLCRRHGFAMQGVVPAIIRQERGRNIEGFLALLTRDENPETRAGGWNRLPNA